MIDAYRRFPLKYQLGAIAVLSMLGFLLGWQVHETWLVGGFATGFLLLLHFFMTKLNSLLALIAIIMQAVSYGGLMVGIKLYGATLFAILGMNLDFAFYGLACYAITVIGVYIYIAYKYSRGRMWINLATAFLISWLASFAIVLLNPLLYVTALTVGFVAGAVFLLARMPNQKKKEPFARPTLTKEATANAEKLFKDNSLHFVKLDTDSPLKGHYYAYNEYSGYLINVVKPKQQFSVTSTGIIADGLNLAPVMENAQASILSMKKELDPELLIPILLVLSPFQSLQPVMTVAVSRWKQPDNMLGVMNILTSKGFCRFIRATKGEMKKLKPEKQNQIKKISEKLTSV